MGSVANRSIVCIGDTLICYVLRD